MDFILKLLSVIFGSGKSKDLVIGVIKDQLIGKGGGLPALIDLLKANGLGDAAASWVGTGKNLPVTKDQLAAGLGADKLKDLAAQAGMPVDAFSGHLAKLLPRVVDQLTPGGQLPG